MYEFKVNGETYKVRYGYGVLYQSDLIDRVLAASTGKADDAAGTIKNLIGLTGELLLAGLQKHHSDVFGYDPESPSERKTMIAKACDLIDDYEDEHRDNDEKNGFTLFNDLQKELENNGFLSQITKISMETAADQNATVIPMDHQVKRRTRKVGENQ